MKIVMNLKLSCKPLFIYTAKDVMPTCDLLVTLDH